MPDPWAKDTDYANVIFKHASLNFIVEVRQRAWAVRQEHEHIRLISYWRQNFIRTFSGAVIGSDLRLCPCSLSFNLCSPSNALINMVYFTTRNFKTHAKVSLTKEELFPFSLLLGCVHGCVNWYRQHSRNELGETFQRPFRSSISMNSKDLNSFAK